MRFVPESLQFDPACDADFFAAMPARAAVYVLYGDPGAQPYASKTANLRRRMMRLLEATQSPGRRLNLRERVRRIEYTVTGSEFESRFLLYQWLRREVPQKCAERLRLRFPSLVKLHLGNSYPRVSITKRLGRGPSLYYGPFRSRAVAEKFANDSLDLFLLRRCIEDLLPDPAFPGCIYSEMKMCLAPCFRGCTDADYAAEASRVRTYFDSAGQSLVREIGLQRDQASTALDFEQAGAHHARLEKLKPLLASLPEIVRRVDQLRAVIVQPSAASQAVTMFLLQGGALSLPLPFAIQPAEHAKSSSMESRVEELLATFDVRPRGSLETMEHLALVSRWYYRKTRVGEIFFADDKGELPMRRIVRGIGRVVRGESAEAVRPDVSPTATVTEEEMGRSYERPQ
ncbi:MAG: excinuclease ABC subunit C [Acidobacteriales bacterium]|nr:excinuclease ABC subunit C [Terriglobales bacterium]